MYNKLLILFILLVSIDRLSAQTSMSLSDAIDYAIANHPDVRVAELTVKDAEWQIKENRATALPHVNLGIDYSYYIQQPGLPAEALGFPGEPGQKLTFALRNNLAGSIGVNQLLFNNSYTVGIKAARIYRDYVQLELASVKERVRKEVRDAYLPALLLTESVQVLDSNIENQSKILNETREIYKAGFVEQLDVDRLELIHSTLQTEREALLRQRDILINVFKFTINMPVKEQITLSDDLDKLLNDFADINIEEALDYQNRPEYVALMKARELNEVQVELYDKDWLPTVAAFASYNPSFQGNDKLFWIPSAIAGISISMPIFDGGLSRAKQERARIAAIKVDEQKDRMLRAFDLEVENARNQYRNAIQKLEDQERNLALAEKIQNTTMIKFRAGISSSFEVTQAQSAYFQAQSTYITARYDLLQAIVAFNKALGKV